MTTIKKAEVVGTVINTLIAVAAAIVCVYGLALAVKLYL